MAYTWQWHTVRKIQQQFANINVKNCSTCICFNQQQESNSTYCRRNFTSATTTITTTTTGTIHLCLSSVTFSWVTAWQARPPKKTAASIHQKPSFHTSNSKILLYQYSAIMQLDMLLRTKVITTNNKNVHFQLGIHTGEPAYRQQRPFSQEFSGVSKKDDTNERFSVVRISASCLLVLRQCWLGDTEHPARKSPCHLSTEIPFQNRRRKGLMGSGYAKLTSTSGYAMWFTAAPKPLKIQVFWGSPSPRGSHSPYILGDTTRPGHVT